MNLNKYLVTLFFFVKIIFTFSICSGQVNTEKYRKEYDKRGFVVNNAFLFGFTTGNIEYLSIKEFFRLDYIAKKSNYFLVGSYHTKKSDSARIINQGFMHLRGIRNISDRFSVETFIQKEFSEFIDLNDRNLIGGGGRINLINYQSKDTLSTFRIFCGFGLMYEAEVYDTEPENTKKNLLRSTNYLTMKWDVNDKIEVSNVTYFQPSLERFRNFRIVSELNVEFLIIKKVYFSVDFAMRYDNEPVTNVEKYDISINNGLRFTIP